MAICLGVLSLACITAADTQFYQDASFLELVITQAFVCLWTYACHFDQHILLSTEKYQDGDVMMQAKYNPFPDLPFAGEWASRRFHRSRDLSIISRESIDLRLLRRARFPVLKPQSSATRLIACVNAMRPSQKYRRRLCNLTSHIRPICAWRIVNHLSLSSSF